jgi:hypothetical protein
MKYPVKPKMVTVTANITICKELIIQEFLKVIMGLPIPLIMLGIEADIYIRGQIKARIYR